MKPDDIQASIRDAPISITQLRTTHNLLPLLNLWYKHATNLEVTTTKPNHATNEDVTHEHKSIQSQKKKKELWWCIIAYNTTETHAQTPSAS